MKYSSYDEIIFKYVVGGLIEVNKSRDEIIEILLEATSLCDPEIIQRYDELVEKKLNYSWNLQDGYYKQKSLFENENTYLPTSEKLKKKGDKENEEQKYNHGSLNNIIHNITNSQDGRIQNIEELKLACTLLDDCQKIEISQNDTATLLKNIACIESKLNQIARAVNTMAAALNIDRNNQDKYKITNHSEV